ncbi:hypothetical protein BP6252_11427 [Coleophoma cylindrospora]|uniref:DUF1989 domain-containing protein n=1 Tax=Coleophoma cylindrospora TaxID=1849047 RepID=A0A3D8QKN5_9HELO|nr:hypothetical protein BP6252_11427 [Coleophoma cylindrospora]
MSAPSTDDAGSRQPQPAYQASQGSPLVADQKLYSAIANSTTSNGGRELTDSFIISPRSGRAWTVPVGSICRITTPDGPQVGDLNIFNSHDPKEHLWTARSRQLHRSHLVIYDRLWSNLPYLRPLVTVIANSLEDYGVDGVGGRVHDLLGTRCDPYVNKMLTGAEFDFHCHSNLARAIKPFGLAESDVHDNVNLFQVTGLNKDGQYFIEPSPAKAGDYIEFFAEIDLLFALSACPAGDESVFGWGADAMERMEKCCRPLKVDVYKLQDPQLLSGWTSPQCPSYKSKD